MREELVTFGGLRAISVAPDLAEEARAVVALLHGFEMTPRDLAPFAHSLGVPAWFLFPEAPLAAASRGRAWWHIDPVQRAEAIARGPRDFATIHPPDLPAARAALATFLDALGPAIGDRPLIVGGFSQGGMLTCDTLLRTARRVDGVALLSASRIAYSEWAARLPSRPFQDVPMLISHGTSDPDLAFEAGLALRDSMVNAGADVTWVAFDEGHAIPLPVWRQLRKFLLARVR
ncbi:alpha/beta hydrolase [Pendulispora albinea]|uniref:Phospholipase/carboxylesterase/thioesterase domain-containing protein n=1 Tax=Pendulispora albinea TaxID=2741071 RepID=A0ABZ2M6Z1_9BACT